MNQRWYKWIRGGISVITGGISDLNTLTWPIRLQHFIAHSISTHIYLGASRLSRKYRLWTSLPYYIYYIYPFCLCNTEAMVRPTRCSWGWLQAYLHGWELLTVLTQQFSKRFTYLCVPLHCMCNVVEGSPFYISASQKCYDSSWTSSSFGHFFALNPTTLHAASLLVSLPSDGRQIVTD